MRILLIDDDPDIRMLAGFVLERAGHALTHAASGRAGVALAASGSFDLVLLDYRLGDATADEILPRIRAARPDARVVLLSGASDTNTIERMRAAGVVGVIAKPFDPETLPERVAKFARKSVASNDVKSGTPDDATRSDPSGPDAAASAHDVGLDPSAIQRMRRIGGDRLLRAMIEAFLENGRARVRAARTAADAGNGAALSEEAHALKSSAGNVGATSLQLVAQRVEREARETDANVRLMATELERAFEQAVVAARRALPD